jgi:tRNA (mo5U34)-methyltransferase
MSADSLSDKVSEITWHHSIDLGDGVVTPGLSAAVMPLEVFPEFRGRTVLDIGAWDGYYSFLAERRGATRVVALDHYVWGLDWQARTEYWNECHAKGVLPDHSRDETDFWRTDLPGRRGFDLARQRLGSQVEPLVANFMTTDLDQLGPFDVVLYLGVLYHMKEPLTALERVRRVTREVAVIETEAVFVPGTEADASLLNFYPGDESSGDSPGSRPGSDLRAPVRRTGGAGGGPSPCPPPS